MDPRLKHAGMTLRVRLLRSLRSLAMTEVRRHMKCSLCGSEFTEETAHSACGGCGFLKGCELVKCPRCGFENAPEPNWAKKLFRKTKHEKIEGSSVKSSLRLDELNVNDKARV